VADRSSADRDSGWVESVREQAARQQAALVHPPFVVWGLAAPPLSPHRVVDIDRGPSYCTSITLGYGDGAASVQVTTFGWFARRDRPDIESALREIGTGSHDTDTTIRVGAARAPARLRTDRTAWVATLTTPTAADVVVTGRGVPFDAVGLARVDELASYWTEYRRRGGEQPRPWPVGLDPHRRLVDAELATRTNRASRRLRFERAVRAQRVIARCDRARAMAVVRGMTEQVCALRADAAWFADPALRARAIAETVRSAALSEDVPSGPAQRAWLVWATTREQGDREAWARAWQRWAVGGS